MMTLTLLAAIAFSADTPDLEQAFRRGGVKELSAAARALQTDKGASETVRILTQALQHRDVGLRAAAAHILGTMGTDGKGAMPELIKALDDDLGRMSEALRELGPGDIPLWLAEAAHDPGNESMAWSALRSLGLKDPRLVPILVRGLSHPRSNVRWYAAGLLGDMGVQAASARAELVRLLLEEPKPDAGAGDYFSPNEARARAAFALGAIQAQPNETVRLLIPMLRHNDAEIRMWSALGLGRLGNKAKAAIPALIETLSDEAMILKSIRCFHCAHPDHTAGTALVNIGASAIPALTAALDAKEARVRWHAADALWHFGEKAGSAVPALVRRFQDPDAQVRCKAAFAARWIAPSAKLLGPEFARLARDKHPEVRMKAASSLGLLEPKKEVSLDPLLHLLDDSEPGVRCAALDSLDRLAPNVALDMALRRMRKDADPSVRKEAVEILSRHGSKMQIALPTLLELCKDGDAKVRRTAATTVARTRPTEVAIAMLIGLTKDTDVSVQASAAETLGNVGPAAMPALYELLKRREESVRAAAARAIGRIRPKAEQAIANLAPLLKDKSADVQAAASEAIGHIGPSAMPALLDMLKSETGAARPAIVSALGNIGPDAKAAVPTLMSLLKDADAAVRRAAASALGDIGEDAREAIPSLVGLLRDKTASVRCAAAEALGDIGPAAKVATAALVRAQHDPDEDVRNAAADALDKIQWK